GKLIRISYEKKRIKTSCNQIIEEYIKKYERAPELLDGEAVKTLNDFLNTLLGEIGDTPIAFLISKLLFKYYRDIGDRDRTITMLECCTVFDIIIKEHIDDYPGSEYPLLAEKYMAEFDGLSQKAKGSLVNSLMLGVVNRRDMTYGLQKYKEIKKWADSVSWPEEKEYADAQLTRCGENALGFALEAIRRMEYAKKKGTTDSSTPFLDIEKEAPYIEAIVQHNREELESGHNVFPDRVVTRLYCVQADYHLGKITMEELLLEIEECAKQHEDYTDGEKCSALFTANAYYIDYLCKCSDYDEKYILDKSMETVDNVLKNARGMEKYLGSYTTNYCVLMLVNSASAVISFDTFKTTVLKSTVCANKALYVHTMMVKEICLAILDYILEHDPKYFDNVAGHTWEEFRDQHDEAVELMEKCALFHDIGKYFCLDYVSNSSRDLTNDEFEVIKNHPANFMKIYQGAMTPAVQCVYDCALLHHLWYDETHGYPDGGKHTYNKPYVNIISAADSIDAATDNIGRPYGQGKNLDNMIEELNGMRDSRYSGYICDILQKKEVREKIEHILGTRRKEIYFEIYTDE
ncbi:MAG: HD domain-containing protein, partial [[Eubacterium] siraeum]|nr:HD domain-containing protein [[Eubacterium] siraeum]